MTRVSHGRRISQPSCFAALDPHPPPKDSVSGIWRYIFDQEAPAQRDPASCDGPSLPLRYRMTRLHGPVAHRSTRPRHFPDHFDMNDDDVTMLTYPSTTLPSTTAPWTMAGFLPWWANTNILCECVRCAAHALAGIRLRPDALGARQGVRVWTRGRGRRTQIQHFRVGVATMRGAPCLNPREHVRTVCRPKWDAC